MSELNGNHFIADEVISTYATIAVQEVSGVSIPAKMSGGIAEKFGKKHGPKNIRVNQSEEGVKLEIKLEIDYGINIPEVSTEVQNKVTEKTETFTGLKVLSVDIHVTSINTGTNETEEKE